GCIRSRVVVFCRLRGARRPTRPLPASPVFDGRGFDWQNGKIPREKWCPDLTLPLTIPMQTPKPLETAVMFWAGRDPAQTIAELTHLGIHSGQLGIPGDLDLACAPQWRAALLAAR